MSLTGDSSHSFGMFRMTLPGYTAGRFVAYYTVHPRLAPTSMLEFSGSMSASVLAGGGLPTDVRNIEKSLC